MSGSTSHLIGDRTRGGKASDARPVAAELYLLPVTTRVPLKFGPETLTSVTWRE